MGFRPPFGPGRVTFLCVAKEKSPKERPPPLIRPTDVRVPSAHPLVQRHAPMGLWSQPSMASAKVRFEHPCSRAKSGRAVLALSDFAHGPTPLARHPASRPGQEGSPQRTRGDQNCASPQLPSNCKQAPSPSGRGLG